MIKMPPGEAEKGELKKGVNTMYGYLRTSKKKGGRTIRGNGPENGHG